jgi:hypothetical protein
MAAVSSRGGSGLAVSAGVAITGDDAVLLSLASMLVVVCCS